MPSVSIRLRKTSNVSGRVAHDFRTRTPGYADPERGHLNAVLHGRPVDQSTLRDELERQHLEHTGRRRRKDSALLWEGIITFSADADLTDRKAYDAAAQRLVNEIAARHGFNEPLWLVRHEDESRAHYHFSFANAHTETAKPVRLSPNDMRQLQDLAGEIFSPLGLSRGKPKAERIKDGEPAHKWINRSVRQLHNDLPKEVEILEQKIANLEEKLQKTTERLEKTQAKLEQAQGENERLQKRLETYHRRLKTLQAQIDKTYDDLERLEDLHTPDEKALIASEKLLRAVEALHRTQPPPSATTEQSGLNLGEPKSPKVIVRYNASVLDYGTKLVATGDGTRKQQAAALYAEARSRNWEQIEFWGMDESQVRWLAEAALSDGIDINFREDWAQDLYEEIRMMEEVNRALSAPDEHRGPESDF